jgi:hexosaminidase
MVEKARAASSVAALFLLLPVLTPASPTAVIPLPAQIIPGDGVFQVSAGTVVIAAAGDPAAAQAARYLVGLWYRTNALKLSVDERAGASATPPPSSILFERVEGFGPEAYRIEVRRQRITIAASDAAGLFYGAVTVWQLLPPGVGSEIAAQIIVDSPRYAWRGLMLDSARHFQSPAFIRSMIEWMSWHKLNVLHWHLTDDQGWRLQILKYPRLTSVGAWRGSYGGFYTQAQVRDIVAFAATRHVQIVPEIDMPGHATAAIAAYPALGVNSGPNPPRLAVSDHWGVHTHLFNLEPGTFEFLEHVLTEVMQLFPSAYIHVGGDEAVKDEWQASPEVQVRARQLGITDADALQAYFTQKMDRFLVNHGKRLVGWDEILNPGLSTDAIVMSWRGVNGAHTAAIAGNDTVLSPQESLYFDRRQSALATEPPGRLTVISLKEVYEFEPRDLALADAQQQHVLGVQANLWTEHIQTEQRVEWMALPRAAALAEVAWSTSGRSWPEFLERLVPMFARYRAFGLNYADSAFGIDSTVERNAGRTVTITLATAPAAGVDIHYTLNGSDPSASSPRYAAPLALSMGTEIRAASYLGPAQTSRIWRQTIDSHAGLRRDSHQLDLCSNRVGLLLQPDHGRTSRDAPLAVDIMNPCWIYRSVDLSRSHRIVASVARLPFNYELGAETASVRVGDARTPIGELDIHIDTCDSPVVASVPLASAAAVGGVVRLPPLELAAQLSVPAQPQRKHDLCLRFARPRLDPLWALDWIEIGE